MGFVNYKAKDFELFTDKEIQKEEVEIIED